MEDEREKVRGKAEEPDVEGHKHKVTDEPKVEAEDKTADDTPDVEAHSHFHR